MSDPLCPSCCRPMRVARTIEPTDGGPEINVFECRVCNVALVLAFVARVPMTQNHMGIAQRAH
jgi:hypothetical protein